MELRPRDSHRVYKEDGRIVDLYWQRSERAVAETDRKYGPYCRTVAYNILENSEDSDECVNDTYLRAWNSMPDARPASLSAYLAKITRNLAISTLRRKNTLRRGGGRTALALEELAEAVPSGESLETRIELRELSERLEAFLGTVGTQERRIFMARYFYMAQVKNIAAKYGFSESKVKSMLSRTRKKLKRYLEEEELC